LLSPGGIFTLLGMGLVQALEYQVPVPSAVSVGQEHRFELANLPRHVLHYRRGQARRVQHHHQAVTPQRPPAEDINVPVLQIKQDYLPHLRYRSYSPRPVTATPALCYPAGSSTGAAAPTAHRQSARADRRRIVCQCLPNGQHHASVPPPMPHRSP
jgi:hypothetical protein